VLNLGKCEIHLFAPSASDCSPLRAYICPKSWPLSQAMYQQNWLVENEKLLLALDIDDTLLKSVGRQPHQIPEDQLCNYPAELVRLLPSIGERVVLSDHVAEFLRKASRLFKLSLCSLGTVEYVREVAEVLDPRRQYFDWDLVEAGTYSIRHEYEQEKALMCRRKRKGGGRKPARPPSSKHFSRVFGCCNLLDPNLEYDVGMAIAVDDLPKMWDSSCRKNVIRVKGVVDANGRWSSPLKCVWKTLKFVHRVFFEAKSQGLPADVREILEQCKENFQV